MFILLIVQSFSCFLSVCSGRKKNEWLLSVCLDVCWPFSPVNGSRVSQGSCHLLQQQECTARTRSHKTYHQENPRRYRMRNTNKNTTITVPAPVGREYPITEL